MKKNISVIIFMMVLNSVVFSQVSDQGLERTSLKGYTENIMKLILKDEFHKAFSEMKKISPLPEMEIDSLELQTIKQLNLVKERFGTPVDSMLIEEKSVSDTFVRFVYVIKYEKHITRWVFIYYKPKTRWVLNSFKWDDDINSLF